MKMRWPFAWRSRVDALEQRCREINLCFERADKASREWASLSQEQQRQIVQLNHRLVEITDLERTTPGVVANVFSEWSDSEQAEFLNIFGRLSHEWEHARCMQFSWIAKYLDDEGRSLLLELAQYAEKA